MKKLIFLLVFIVLLFPLSAEELELSRPAPKKTFVEATIYCSNLQENGSGWRLPTSEEIGRFVLITGKYWVSDDDQIPKEYDDDDMAWFYDYEKSVRKESVVSSRLNAVCVRKKQEEVKPQIVVIENTKDVQAANARADYAEKKAKDAEERARVAEREKYLMKKQTESDQEACNYARQEGSKSGWELYLKKFPDGKCSTEAEWTVRKLKNTSSLDLKLLNSDYYGTYDEINESDRSFIANITSLTGLFPMLAGLIVLPIGLWGDDDLLGYGEEEIKQTRKDCILSGLILIGAATPFIITGITYAVWNDYTKGERAAGFMISFGALIAAGGGTMVGLAEGDEFMFYGGIATAAVGAGMLIGGITMAALDARARELKKKNGYSFSVLPNKDGFYAQMNLNF